MKKTLAKKYLQIISFFMSIYCTFSNHLKRDTNIINFNFEADEELRIAFGSCFQIYDYRNDIFKVVAERKPHLWIWNGDAAYVDDVSYLGSSENKVLKSYLGGDSIMDEEYVRGRFQLTLDDPYQRIKVIGIWDDHDYGVNDGDRYFRNKDINREIFLDFIGESKLSQRRLQNQTGIFQDYLINQNDDISVHVQKILLIIYSNLFLNVILLDLRYDYSKESGDRFGTEQRNWLENCFKNTHADITLIVSGVQLGQKNKQVLFELIREHKKSGVLLLSGDVHFANIYSAGCTSVAGGYTLYEFVSSGLTHHANYFQYLIEQETEWVTSYFFSDKLSRETENDKEQQQFTKMKVDLNFGLIKFQSVDIQGERDIEIQVELINHENDILISKSFINLRFFILDNYNYFFAFESGFKI